MAFAAGGKFASAVSAAGGLGLIGGGYGDADWLRSSFAPPATPASAAASSPGRWRSSRTCSIRCWRPHPRAIFLSFGDPKPFVAPIKASRRLLMCQVQTRRDAEHAIDCGADVIVAQGSEAGGHGERRSRRFTLVPEVADLIAARSPDTLLCAAGGIADGRGLAAALMLGADGVVVGSRFWAAPEAEVSPRMHAAALAACGDDTIRSKRDGSRAQA